MSGLPWISIAPLNPDRYLSMDCEPVPGDEPYPRGYLARNEKGEELGPECFPKVMWRIGDREIKSVPDLFQGRNGFVLSARCVDVLRRFRLGNTKFYEVQLRRRDRTTVIDGQYFYLNIANSKQAFLPDQSPRARTSSGGGWVPPGSLKDDEFAVSSEALAGVDIWVDSQLWDAFFVSDDLGQALRKAGVAKPFWLRRCRIV
jgi:hypothetical protein